MRNFLVAKEFTCSNKRIFRSIDPRDVRSNLNTHLSDTPFAIQQPIQRPHLLERVYKPIRTPHWCGVLQSSIAESIRDRVLVGREESVCPCAVVRRNLAMHCSVTPFVIRQPIHRPRLL